MSRLLQVLATLAVALSVGCGCQDMAAAPPELVLRPGSAIQVKVPEGDSLRIVAGPKYNRRYEWGSCALNANPCPRRTRWLGSLGIYDPAPGYMYLFSSCNGISRPVVEEGQIHFSHKDIADAWVSHQARVSAYRTVWRNDGLLVSWGQVAGRQQLDVAVWQVCVNGKKPDMMPGASDQSILVDTGVGSELHACAQVPTDVMAETEAMVRQYE